MDRFQHSHPFSAGTFANDTRKCNACGASDLRFAWSNRSISGANVKSAPLDSVCQAPTPTIFCRRPYRAPLRATGKSIERRNPCGKLRIPPSPTPANVLKVRVFYSHQANSTPAQTALPTTAGKAASCPGSDICIILRGARLRMSGQKGHWQKYESRGVLDLTFAMTTRGNVEANFKSTAPGRRRSVAVVTGWSVEV